MTAQQIYQHALSFLSERPEDDDDSDFYSGKEVFEDFDDKDDDLE